MVEFFEQVAVPDECRRCVALARAAQIYGMIVESIRTMSDDMMSGQIRRKSIDEIVAQGVMNREEAEQFVIDNESSIREEVISKLEKMDRVRDAQLKIGRRIVQQCVGGVLEITGERNGVVITIGICMSETREHVPNAENAEVVRVERRPVASTEN